MFKKALLSFAMVAFSGSVLAAPTANIYVKGKLGAPTCTVNGQDTADIIYNFDVEFQEWTYEEPRNSYYLGSQIQPIDIQCDTATSISFDIVDARDGTSIDDNTSEVSSFGLGMHNELKIGAYGIKFLQGRIRETPEAEEKVAYVVVNKHVELPPSNSSGETWLINGDNVSWGGNGNYAVARSFSANLRLDAVINADLKNVAEEVELDGLAILSFSFGI